MDRSRMEIKSYGSRWAPSCSWGLGERSESEVMPVKWWAGGAGGDTPARASSPQPAVPPAVAAPAAVLSGLMGSVLK